MAETDETSIPDHLKSTWQMLKCAFPKGIGADDYFPVLAVLEEKMAHEPMAIVMSVFTGKSYPHLLNDVYRVTSTDVPDSKGLRRVKQRLLACGYDAWVKEHW
jgi:hypothetical protein